MSDLVRPSCSVSNGPKLDEKPKLTPYQGTGRGFGLYKCKDCKRSWGSAASWANSGQQCFTCNTNIYPHVQFPIRRNKNKNKDKDNKKPHLTKLCEKCNLIKTNCCKYTEIERAEGDVNAKATSNKNRKRAQRRRANRQAGGATEREE